MKTISTGGSVAHGIHIFSGPKNESIKLVRGDPKMMDDYAVDAKSMDVKYEMVSMFMSSDRRLSLDELEFGVSSLCHEMGIPQDQVIVVEHEKKRASQTKAGFDAGFHWHILGPYVVDGKCVDLKNSFLRVERVMRELELKFDLPTQNTRHNPSILKYFDLNNPAAAEKMRKAGCDEEAEKPESRMTTGAWREAQTKGFKRTDFMADAETVWKTADTLQAGLAALRDAGYTVRMGDSQVIVQVDDNVVGSLARLTSLSNQEAKDLINANPDPRRTAEKTEKNDPPAGTRAVRSGEEETPNARRDEHHRSHVVGHDADYGSGLSDRSHSAGHATDGHAYEPTDGAARGADGGPRPTNFDYHAGDGRADRSDSYEGISPEGPSVSVIRTSVFAHQGSDWKNRWGFIVPGTRTFDIDGYRRVLDEMLGNNRQPNAMLSSLKPPWVR